VLEKLRLRFDHLSVHSSVLMILTGMLYLVQSLPVASGINYDQGPTNRTHDKVLR